jgi:transcription initiation protein SPT3
VRKKANESQGNTNTTGVEGDDFLDEVAEAEKAQRIKRKQIKLSWELRAAYSDVLNLGDDDSESSDEDDEEVYQASLQRLKEADDVTRHMTREEYVHYSECRQASFTFRKGKRFREWLNMSAYMDTRPNDDVVDILGYLGFEAVRTLVEMALRVRKERDKDIVVEKKEVSMFGNKRKADEMTSEGLFATRNVDRKPLEPRDVVEAFRRLQVTKKPCWNFRGGLAKVKVSLI